MQENNNLFYKMYQIIFLCQDSVNNDSLSVFEENLIKNVHKYDQKATISNILFHGNMKCAYEIEGKKFANIITANIKLLHNDNLLNVISNLRRIYNKNNSTIRNIILGQKKAMNLSDISNLRKQVEAPAYLYC